MVGSLYLLPHKKYVFLEFRQHTEFLFGDKGDFYFIYLTQLQNN